MWSFEGCQTNRKWIAEFPGIRQCSKAEHKEEGGNPTSVHPSHSYAYIEITYAL